MRRDQQSVFTNWVNFHLHQADEGIQNIETDFSDGKKLCSLVEQLSGKKISGVKEPKLRVQKLYNVMLAMGLLKSEGKSLVSCDAQDVVDQHLQLILGMVWNLITQYQLQLDIKMDARSLMLRWVGQFKEVPQLVSIKDLSKSWEDGIAFCALVAQIAPDKIDISSLNKEDKLANLNLAFSTAEQLGVPRLLDPLTQDFDECGIVTYLSFFLPIYREKGIGTDIHQMIIK